MNNVKPRLNFQQRFPVLQKRRRTLARGIIKIVGQRLTGTFALCRIVSVPCEGQETSKRLCAKLGLLLFLTTNVKHEEI
jgi:hypothetical protein